jgi:4'-phosphopantetheinyl transferase
MIKIYFSSYKNKLNDSAFSNYLNLLPQDLKEKILCFKKWEDQHASLYGKLLLKNALEDLGINSGLTNLKYTTFGRPYLENNIDFNISHSGYFVVCAISDDRRIGIDIEEIKHISISAFKNFFSEEELKAIFDSDNIYFLFYYYWTAKEAAIKANGKGLSVSLENVRIINNTTKLEETLWFITSLLFDEDYILQIACDKIIEHKLEFLEISFELS